jgi:hypothetical protein
MKKVSLALLLSLSVTFAFAQGVGKVNNDNFNKIFKDLESKKAYIFFPGDYSTKAKVLGYISTSKYDSNSLANKYGEFGNKFNSDSIWNKFGNFGGKFQSNSPWNKFSTTALEILYREGGSTYIVGYLTANEFYAGKKPVALIHPKYLAYYLDRAEDIPE